MNVHQRGDQRFYEIDGREYPSVNTVLSVVRDGKFLERWRGDLGNEQADAIMEEAGDLGTAVHACAAYYACQHFSLETDTASSDYQHVEWLCELTGQPEVAFRMSYRYMDWLLARVQAVEAVEQVVFSHQYQYAGRLDLFAIIDGRPAVIDLKTGRTSKRVGMQLAAYGRAGREMGIMQDYDRLIVHISKESPHDVTVTTVKNEAADFSAFLNALGLWRYLN